MARLSAHAKDITCEGCANAIRRALTRLDGVQAVQVDVPSQVVSVEYDETTVEARQVLDKLSRAGFDSTPQS